MMIITPHFVFIHLHKSGGSFVNHVLARIFPQAISIGYHAPRAVIPTQFRHLPILGSIRNPWSYYVSWYFFQRARQNPNALFRTVSNGDQLPFNKTITNLVQLGQQPSYYERLLEELPEELPNRGLNLNKAGIAALKGYQAGFYSFLVRRMYGDPESVHMIKMENLREELLAALQHFGVPLDDETITMIRASKKRNTSKHAEFSRYYDSETSKLVGLRDAALINRFGYTFNA